MAPLFELAESLISSLKRYWPGCKEAQNNAMSCLSMVSIVTYAPENLLAEDLHAED